MKIKKTITNKVIAANSKNAQKSTGPKDLDAIKHNACTHRLLSKKLIFQNDEEEREFEEMLEELQADQNASELLERILVEEVAACIWKLRMTEGWDIKELLKRRVTAKAVLEGVANNIDDEQQLLNNCGAEAVQRGWDCQALVVRTDARNHTQHDNVVEGTKKNTGEVHIEAKLTTWLDSLVRHRSAVKRDLYRAMAALRKARDGWGDGGQRS